MTMVEISEEAVSLKSLLATMKAGEEILLTDGNAPVAKLISVAQPKQPHHRRLGLWESLPGPFWMAPDFDAPLEDFREYME
jgi:antitoxin (DNA-binding transcriptional repressor) of toxin-antitoxin stability system